MISTRTFPDPQAASCTGRLRRLAVCVLLALAGLARTAPAQAPTPAPTPAPAPVVQTQDEILPMSEDPNDPTASPQERMLRQRSFLMNKINERIKKAEEARRAATQELTPPQPTGQAAPNILAVPDAAGGPPPQPGLAPGTAPGQQPAPGAPGARPPGAGHKELSPDKRSLFVTFYLSPVFLTVSTGERFSTECRLLNQDHLPVDGVDINLSYPTHNLRLVAIHQDKIKEMLKDPPLCRVDEKAGTIAYHAKLKRPVRAVEAALITLVWEARRPSDASEIRPAIGKQYSLVWGGPKLLSEAMTGIEGAAMGMTVRIDGPERATPLGDRFMELGNAELMAAGFKDQRQVRPPRLWIRQPENEILQPGQWIVVDVGVDNPAGAVFDEVRLAASFDPETVEISDSDRGNWIGEGINLLDGPFHRDWPWDNQYANVVDRERGLFYYRMGMNDLREQPSGTLARLFVRVKRPVQAPLFTWLWSENPDPETPASGVYLFNRNIHRRVLKRSLNAALEPSGKNPALDLAPGMEKANPSVYRF